MKSVYQNILMETWKSQHFFCSKSKKIRAFNFSQILLKTSSNIRIYREIKDWFTSPWVELLIISLFSITYNWWWKKIETSIAHLKWRQVVWEFNEEWIPFPKSATTYLRNFSEGTSIARSFIAIEFLSCFSQCSRNNYLLFLWNVYSVKVKSFGMAICMMGINNIANLAKISKLLTSRLHVDILSLEVKSLDFIDRSKGVRIAILSVSWTYSWAFNSFYQFSNKKLLSEKTFHSFWVTKVRVEGSVSVKYEGGHVCGCVCMYVCMYACMYVCMYVRMYVCMYVCVYVSMSVFTYVYMFARMHVCLFVRMYLSM